MRYGKMEGAKTDITWSIARVCHARVNIFEATCIPAKDACHYSSAASSTETKWKTTKQKSIELTKARPWLPNGKGMHKKKAVLKMAPLNAISHWQLVEVVGYVATRFEGHLCFYCGSQSCFASISHFSHDIRISQKTSIFFYYLRGTWGWEVGFEWTASNSQHNQAYYDHQDLCPLGDISSHVICKHA